MFASNPHENKGPVFAGFVAVFMALAIIFTSLRLYVRGFITKGLGKDDVLLVISLILYIVLCASCFISIRFGNGRHTLDVNLTHIPIALRLWWLGEVFYTITTLVVRITVAVFLLRLSRRPMHRWIIYGTTLIYTLFSIFFFFLVIFQCKPISFFWGQYAGMKGTCEGSKMIPGASIAQSVVSFVADWIMGLLPIWVLAELQMNIRMKISVASLLSLGLLAGITAMIRIPLIKDLAITDDWLYKNTDVAICSVIEPGLGIIAIAGATFRPLLRAFFTSEHDPLNTSRSSMRQSRWYKYSRHSNPRPSNTASNSSLTGGVRKTQSRPSSLTIGAIGVGKAKKVARIEVERLVLGPNPLHLNPSPKSSFTRTPSTSKKGESMMDKDVEMGIHPVPQHPSERFPRFTEEGVGRCEETEPEKKGGTMVFTPETGKMESHPFAQIPTGSSLTPPSQLPPSSPFPKLPHSKSESVLRLKFSTAASNFSKSKTDTEGRRGIHIQKTVHITCDPADKTPERFLNTEVSSPASLPRKFSTVSASSEAQDEGQPTAQMDSLILGRIPSPSSTRGYEIVRPGTSHSDVSTWTVETTNTMQTGSEVDRGERDREREIYLSKIKIARSGSLGVLGGRRYDVNGSGSGNEDSGDMV